MDSDKKKQTIKFCLAITALVIILIVVVAIMIKYEVEGDKNMPFNLSKILIVSTAEGVEAEGDSKWNFNVFQNNDIYFYIDKNESYDGKTSILENVKIENIQITSGPELGQIKAYMPNSVEGRLYSYSNDYIIEEKLEYKGAVKSNPQTLEIGNQGGSALIRLSNTNLGTYSSNEDKQITHDGTLLKKLDINNEQIKFTVSFDFIITANGNTYKSNIVLDLPSGDIIQNGTESIEKTDMSDIIFKRK